MMRNHQLLPWLASVLAVLTLSGCMGDTTGDLREWVRQERKNTKPNIQHERTQGLHPSTLYHRGLDGPLQRSQAHVGTALLDSEKGTANTNLLEQEAQSSQARAGKLPPGCHLDGWKHAPKWQRNCFSTGE